MEESGEFPSEGRCELRAPVRDESVMESESDESFGEKEFGNPGGEEPIGRLGGRRSSPGVRVFDCHSGWQPAKDDQQPEEDCDATESVRTNVYVTFISPGAEDQWNAYSVEVSRVGWVDSDARSREWQTDTQQLIERLAVQAPQLAGRPVTVAHWTVLCCSCRTP